jgi:hypothetical protein
LRIETVPVRLSDDDEQCLGLLRQQLAELEALYRQEAAPILKRMADIEATRQHQHYAFPDENDHAVFQPPSSSGSTSP